MTEFYKSLNFSNFSHMKYDHLTFPHTDELKLFDMDEITKNGKKQDFKPRTASNCTNVIFTRGIA